ncbi:hypothetical protein LV779_25540 [Streptomyces thinghirensis]|nr:hypothetical protein [Streptomyces thinghirensis]
MGRASSAQVENSTAEQRRAATALLDKIQKERPQFFGSFAGKLRLATNKVQERHEHARHHEVAGRKAEGPDAGQGGPVVRSRPRRQRTRRREPSVAPSSPSPSISRLRRRGQRGQLGSAPSGGDQLKDEQVAELTAVLAAQTPPVQVTGSKAPGGACRSRKTFTAVPPAVTPLDIQDHAHILQTSGSAPPGPGPSCPVPRPWVSAHRG